MTAIKEKWEYGDNKCVWVGKYLNSRNDLHWHDDCELLYVESGKIQVFLDGDIYDLTCGNAMFIDSRLLHKIIATPPHSILQVIVFDNAIMHELGRDQTLASPIIEDGGIVSEAYSQIFNELKSKRPMYPYMAESLVRRLMIELFRKYPTTPKKPHGNTNETLKKLLNTVKVNFEWYTLDDAAKFMGMEVNYFSHFFRKKTGIPFTRYINSIRTEKALELIKTGEYAMSEIAVRCGFGTIRTFNNVIKSLTGYTPSKIPDDYEFAMPSSDTATHPKPSLKDNALIENS